MRTLERERPSCAGMASPTILSGKITARHLERLAVVYVRQSSVRQVRENIESTQLQYSLVDRARACGWPEQRIEVIDDDLGISGQSLEGRAGFQRLLAEISLGHVGIVLGIEMSRLARNCRDWHQLLELCAVFDTLLGDADGIYNPREHNDRLLLGLKGTMSEAELHVLHNRLHAGRLNKARRGEYFSQAPIGYVRTRDGFALEPDEQARNVVRLVFDKLEELGSVAAVLRYFHRERIQIGVRRANGREQSSLSWRPAHRSTLLNLLRHPIYAGAYVFGRGMTDSRRSGSGAMRTRRRLAKPEEWQVLLHDRLPSYITWDQWERNQRRIRENSTRFGSGPPRGASLLAGRVYCGRCGARMSVQYSGRSAAHFLCRDAQMNRGEPICQTFEASFLEPIIGELVLTALEPASVELSLLAADSIESDRARVLEHHRQTVERAVYQTGLVRRRYEEVDPSNRLVAAELERSWEASLQLQRRAEEAFHRLREATPAELTPQQRQSVRDLAADFPALWRSDLTTDADRQSIVRTLVERVIVDVAGSTERLAATVRWAGGYESHHETRRRVQSFSQLEAQQDIARLIQRLYDEGCPLSEIARQLNHEGYHPAKGRQFTKTSVGALCRMLRRKKLIAKTPKMEPNYWRAGSLCNALRIGKPTLSGWRHRGWVQARQIGSRWIYWADAMEMARLRKLAAHPASGSTPTPKNLTKPVQRMPPALGKP
jgi:DNA invertase Pin-like site-specific DNA recombinase